MSFAVLVFRLGGEDAVVVVVVVAVAVVGLVSLFEEFCIMVS